MSFSFGNKIKISLFGQSHSSMMGCVIDGLPSGFKIDTDKLSAFMARRAPGNDEFSTPRKEADEVKFVSGLVDGVTCGAPVCAIIENTNTRSKDYDNLKDIPRPGHSDFAAWAKFGASRDASGGGQFSGRLTATMCIAGGILTQLYEKQGIYIGAHIASVGHIKDTGFDSVNVNKNDFVGYKPFPVIDDTKGEEMKELIRTVRAEGDSIGGTIECAVCGLAPGLGDTLYDSIESRISQAVFAVPAVKGIEFGNGFESAKLRGSENNDAFCIKNGQIVTKTNNHGGILGGISSGMPIIFSTAIKPTPSISKEQESVSLSKQENTILSVKGRHDPCIVKRAAVCIEAAAAIALADILL